MHTPEIVKNLDSKAVGAKERYRVIKDDTVPTTTSTEKIPPGFVQIDNKKKESPILTRKEEHQETVHTKVLLPKSGDTMVDKSKLPHSYVSVTKQVTGVEESDSKLPSIPGKNFESTYYTKSSTCGYFTFSCKLLMVHV